MIHLNPSTATRNATLVAKQHDRKSSIITGNLSKSDDIFQKYAASQSKKIHKTDTAVVVSTENKHRAVTSTDDISKKISTRKLENKKPTKNLNKIQYKNKHLWSKKSVELEKMLKPLVVTDGDCFPEYDVLAYLTGGTEIGMVDSLVFSKSEGATTGPAKAVDSSAAVDSNNAVAVDRDAVTRMFTPWSYFAEEFMFTKVRQRLY